MPTECEICFDDEKEYINPCGAFNNCQARVCDMCRERCNPDVDDSFLYECPFCKSLDYKRDFMLILQGSVFDFEYYDDDDEIEGCGWNKTSYIAFIMQVRSFLESDLSKQAFEKMPFCVPCDLEHSGYLY